MSSNDGLLRLSCLLLRCCCLELLEERCDGGFAVAVLVLSLLPCCFDLLDALLNRCGFDSGMTLTLSSSMKSKCLGNDLVAAISSLPVSSSAYVPRLDDFEYLDFDSRLGSCLAERFLLSLMLDRLGLGDGALLFHLDLENDPTK